MLRKKEIVKMPVRKESQYITRWALIGLLVTARQISQPIRARDRITAIAISIYQPISSKYFPSEANMPTVNIRLASFPGSDRYLIYSAAK